MYVLLFILAYFLFSVIAPHTYISLLRDMKLCSFLSGGSGFFFPCFGGGKKNPTVGRRSDPQWVVSTTYSRFFRRPTVGRKMGAPRCPLQAGWRGVRKVLWEMCRELARRIEDFLGGWGGEVLREVCRESLWRMGDRLGGQGVGSGMGMGACLQQEKSRAPHIVRSSALWFWEGGRARRRGTRTRLGCLPSGE